MTANNMICEVLVAASLMTVAACGAVAAPDAADDDVDGAGGIFHDEVPPVIALSPSTVKDERGDSVEFSMAGPVHTHVGPDVDLGGEGCPAVYKYGYLMDAEVPFGVETQPNPLAWHFTIVDAQLDSTQFRVRTDDGEVALAWSPLPAPDPEGVYTIELTRNGGASPVPLLGTRTGTFYLDVRARDRGESETDMSWCWEHHPLAAPLAVSPLAKDEVFDWHFTDDSPISRTFDPGTTRLVHQRIVQHSAEPVALAWSATHGSIEATWSTVQDLVNVEGANVICMGSTDPVCSGGGASYVYDPADAPPQTAVTDAPLWAVLVDESSGAVLQTSDELAIRTTLPARGANEPPKAYRVVVMLGAVTQFAAPANYTGSRRFHEQTFNGQHFIGYAPTQVAASCLQWSNSVCTRYVRTWQIEGLDTAKLSIEPISSTLTINGEPPTTYTTGALVWDAGNDDLPGPQH